LPWNAIACARCALPLPLPAAACGRCLRTPPPQSASFAPLRYAAPIDRLLQRFKFHAGLAEGRVLSQLLCEYRPATLHADVLILPLPLHAKRLGTRGSSCTARDAGRSTTTCSRRRSRRPGDSGPRARASTSERRSPNGPARNPRSHGSPGARRNTRLGFQELRADGGVHHAA
jgi:predicted amidophosphoribosyltransferase